MNEKLDSTLKAIWDSLTDEQKAKAKDCKTVEELVLFAGRESIELPDEALEKIAGGIPFGDLREEDMPKNNSKSC